MDLVKDLTKRQREIFDFISRYLSRHGYPPTVREIGQAVGLHSSSTVHAHLCEAREPRACSSATPRSRARSRCSLSGPRGRCVRPGCRWSVRSPPATPILAEENIEDYIEVPDVVGGEDGDYILRVRGESMKDAGILEGDFVVVRPAERARDGEIVVALVGDDEATVKRFFREKNQVRLQPENKSMKPIRTRDVRLLGRVVGVFRRVS